MSILVSYSLFIYSEQISVRYHSDICSVLIADLFPDCIRGRPAVCCVGQPKPCSRLGLLWRLRSVRRCHFARHSFLPRQLQPRLGLVWLVRPWGRWRTSPWHSFVSGCVQPRLGYVWQLLLLKLDNVPLFRALEVSFKDIGIWSIAP